MMITRRALLALAMGVGTGLVGCGGGSGNGPTSPSGGSNGQYGEFDLPAFKTGKIVYLAGKQSESSRPPLSGPTITLVRPGGQPQSITQADAIGAFNSSPTLSPDGNRIAFVSQRDGSTDLYSINIDGSGLKRLTESGPSVRLDSPQWTPDGSRLYYVFDSPPSAGGQGVGVVSVADGRPLTFFSGENPFVDIAISSDGRNLAYITSAVNGDSAIDRATQVSVISLEDFKSRRLTTSLTSKTSLTFAPDGQRLAFSAGTIASGTRGMLSIIDLDGTGERERPTGGDIVEDVTWAPDGQTLAYSGGGIIALIRAEGKVDTVRLPLGGPPKAESAPSWGR